MRKRTVCNKAKPAARTCLYRGLIALLLLLPAMASSQIDSTRRVLVLHGVWEAGPWDMAIDRGIVDVLDQNIGAEILVSFQYLGIDSVSDQARLNDIKNNIEYMLRQQHVDLIVAVQALASNFVLNLSLPEPTPRLLLLPRAETIAAARELEDVAVVQSASGTAISETLDHIARLRPETPRIVVVGGNSGDDIQYVEQVQEAAQRYSGQLHFDYLIGVDPDRLTRELQQLSSEDTVLTLPFSTYTDSNGALAPVGSEYFDSMIGSVSAPLFGIYDRLLGQGLTGGSLSSTDGYAATVGRLSLARLETGVWPTFLTAGDATPTYDWREAERFALDLSQLGGPLRLINEEQSLWDEDPVMVLLVGNTIAALLLALLVMAYLLKRSRQSRAAIAASEQRLREKEAQYRLLATNTVDVIWTWDGASEKVTYCSPSIEKLTGYTVEEYLSTPFSRLVTPESLKRCYELYKLGGESRDKLIEVEHYTKSGGTVWCEMSARPVDIERDPYTRVGVTRDISQRKKEELHRTRLEASIRQNQKFESLGTLAGGIAHDFNNVLGVMMGLIDLLAEDTGKQGREAEILGKLDSSAQKAKRLVQRILAFARHREGDMEVLDLVELSSESLELLQSGLPPEVSLESSLARGEIPVKADRTQIEQLILNIGSNAIEAVKQRGGIIRCALDTLQINEMTDFPHGKLDPGRYAKLVIEDDGPGMDKATVDRIFDPFYSSKEMGSGMGLAIVRSVIVRHNGAIDVVTQPGMGARFEVYLPLSDEKIQKSRASSIELDVDKSMLILLVDDQQDILDTSCMMLEKLGHRCLVATGPAEAETILREKKGQLDLVISDYSMPGKNGLDFLNDCVREYPGIHYVITTGYGDALPNNPLLVDQRLLRVLQKPYNFKELRALISQVQREAMAG
jgi:PAS domain S-box-containing protein